MILRLIVKLYGQLFDRIPLRPGDISGFLHPVQDGVPSLQGLVRIKYWIISCRLVDHSHKRCAFLYIKVYRILAEEGSGRYLYTIRIAAERYSIKVHGHNLVLSIVFLQPDGGNPFLKLAPDSCFGRILSHLIQVLCHLLADGTATALAPVLHEQGFERYAPEAGKVDAGMVVETGILRCNGCLHYIRRNLVVAH